MPDPVSPTTSPTWPPLRVEDLPVTREFEPNNYANAQKLRVLYFACVSALTPDQRTEFVDLLKSRAFCRPANNPSPTANPLFQSLLVTGRFTWPKWMVLGTVYGVDHDELTVVKTIVESLFGQAEDLNKPPGFEAENHGFEAFLRHQPRGSSVSDQASTSPTGPPSTTAKAASETVVKAPSAADFAALLSRLEALEMTRTPVPAPQGNPDPAAELSSLLGRTQALEGKNVRLEKLLAAQQEFLQNNPDPAVELSSLLERARALEDKSTSLEQLFAARKTQTAQQEAPQHNPDPTTELSSLLKRTQALEAKGARLEKLLAAQKANTDHQETRNALREDRTAQQEIQIARLEGKCADIRQHYHRTLYHVLRGLKHCLVQLPQAEARVDAHRQHLAKLKIRADRLAARMRRQDYEDERFPTTPEAVPPTPVPDYAWIEAWEFNV